MSESLDKEQETLRRISLKLRNVVRLRGPGGRTSVDAAVTLMKRDKYIAARHLSDARLRALICFQAGFDGYCVEEGCDRRSRNTTAANSKVWIKSPPE